MDDQPLHQIWHRHDRKKSNLLLFFPRHRVTHSQRAANKNFQALSPSQ